MEVASTTSNGSEDIQTGTITDSNRWLWPFLLFPLSTSSPVWMVRHHHLKFDPSIHSELGLVPHSLSSCCQEHTVDINIYIPADYVLSQDFIHFN